jgi:hypothetical protein
VIIVLSWSFVDDWTSDRMLMYLFNRFYQPSVTKSLMILEKGIRERFTKNGETLRR